MEQLTYDSKVLKRRYTLQRFDVRDDRYGTLPIAELVFTGARQGHRKRPSDEQDALAVSPALLRVDYY